MECLPYFLRVGPLPVEEQDALVLDLCGTEAVFAVPKLHDLLVDVADRVVVLNRQIFQHLHDAALDVARLCGFHRGVDEPLAPGHRVKE